MSSPKRDEQRGGVAIHLTGATCVVSPVRERRRSVLHIRFAYCPNFESPDRNWNDLEVGQGIKDAKVPRDELWITSKVRELATLILTSDRGMTYHEVFSAMELPSQTRKCSEGH